MNEIFFVYGCIVFSFSALFVVFRPDGKELAVATLDGQISFWDQER